MFHRSNIHLWIIGGLSFVGFAYAEISEIREVGLAAATDAGAKENAPVIDLSAAEELYSRRCGACHSLDAHRIGPRHRGVVGRQAGSLADYDYSDALRQAAFVWDGALLDRWLSNPEALVPGQKMGFRLSSQDERAAIIAYLKAQSE